QSILKSKPQGRVLVQIVIANEAEHVLLAGLSGLLKTAMLENPQVAGQLIQVPATMTSQELLQRLQVEAASCQDTVIPYEGERREVLSWQEIEAEAQKPAKVFQDDGVYLITGGLGGLGLLFAKEILEQTQEARVVLTGRSALTPEKQVRLDGLGAKAGRVR